MADLSSIPGINEADAALLRAALADRTRRVQRVELSRRTVWVKRYGTEAALLWQRFYAPLATLLPVAFRPAPRLAPEAMIEQEMRRIRQFRQAGFRVPEVLCRLGRSLVLSDIGISVAYRLYEISAETAAHEALLVECAATLGRLHAAGLCHGRPAPRDLTLEREGDGSLGFLDFEEEPEAVMPLAAAQGRDLWVLFFQLASRSKTPETTLPRAYAAWRQAAPPAAEGELRGIIRFAARFLPLARLIGRVRMGSDLRRFIVATGYLEKAIGQDSDRQGRTE